MIDSAAQIRKFEELFKQKNFKVEDITYQAWLLFKWDSIGNEQEAFDHVLKKRKPSLQPKKKRERVAPEGSGRYHLNDARWDPIYVARMENEAKNKKRVANNNNSSTSKQVRSRSVAPATVTSGALESVTLVPGSPLSSVTAPASDDNSSNSNHRSRSASASSAVTSEAVDLDLPDIPDLPASNSLEGASNTTSRDKRKRGNNKTVRKRAKLRSTEVRGTAISTSMELIPTVQKFPLENGVVPLIDNIEEDSFDNSSNNNTEDVGSVVQKAKTFLDDLDLEMDTDLQELNMSITAQPIPKISGTVNNNNNNNTNSKTPRASGRFRSRVNTAQPASTVPSSGDPNSTYSIIPTNNNMLSPVTSSVAASQSSSVSITIIDDCDEILDKETKTFNEIPTMKLKAVTYAKIKIKNKKKFAKKKC